MDIQLRGSIRDIDREAWNALVGDDDPFVEHGFLLALEEGGAVTPERGWTPKFLLLTEAGELRAALPLYLKEHSYGEFIFDWAWAGASEQLGAPYYPKLVSMVPFTPATGRRVLRAPGVSLSDVGPKLAEGLLRAAEETGASSVHVLFTTAEEAGALSRSGQLFRRLSYQFHWHNRGYADFGAFLADFRAPARKQTRRERESVRGSGLHIETRAGSALTDADWAALKDFYALTCEKKGSPEYLPPEFFDAVRLHAGERAVGVLAYRDGAPVAGTLNFEKGPHLYGRYWGAYEEVDSLHFELCYYQLIERAIARGMVRVEAGAQGMHKLRRGLLPHATHSVHWVRHPVLARAVKDYVVREARAVEREMELLLPHGPFKREGGGVPGGGEAGGGGGHGEPGGAP